MNKFISFLKENADYIFEAAMTTSGSSASDHVKKYLQPHQTKSLSYEMAKDSGGAKRGEAVKVHKVQQSTNEKGDTQYHAHIEHSGGKSVVPIGHLMKPAGVGRAGKGSEDKEDKAVTDLHSHIQNAVKAGGGSSIKIKHMGKTYNVAGARKVVSSDFKGRKPKADIVLHDEHGKSQVFLSHKAGAKATDAQNYEGLSAHGEHKQVAKFVSDLHAHAPKGISSGQSFTRQFSPKTAADKKLHRDVMFGSEQSSGVHGVHNVHSIVHGDVGVQKSGRHHVLTSAKTINNDETFKHSEHPLEMTARYATGRKDNGVQNARIGIAKAGSRPSSKTLPKAAQ